MSLSQFVQFSQVPPVRQTATSLGRNHGHAVTAGRTASRTGDVKNGLDEGLRRLLGEVVPDTSLDLPMLIFASEHLGV